MSENGAKDSRPGTQQAEGHNEEIVRAFCVTCIVVNYLERLDRACDGGQRLDDQAETTRKELTIPPNNV